MAKRIFIIDDDVDILLALQELLEIEGYTVETESNPVVALQCLKANKTLPDLILLDWRMPEMSGYEFIMAQKLDVRIASVPVLLMTASLHSNVERTQLGVRAYAKKPIDIDDFLKTIKKCLR